MAQVMGVINVTPDSFVATTRTPSADDAVARALEMVADGATIVDIGGESTRPGAEPVSVDRELSRVIPVVDTLAERLGDTAKISIDTRNEGVARAAVDNGARIINDMSATLGPIAGELGVGYVVGHMRGDPRTMQSNPVYDDVVAEVLAAVVDAATVAADAGAPQVWIDPGIGFGKTTAHNLQLIAHLDRFVAAEFGVLVGASRKRFIGQLHSASDAGVAIGEAAPTPTDDRLAGSIAIASWAAALGVDIVRVHDVLGSVRALEVVAAGNRL